MLVATSKSVLRWLLACSLFAACLGVAGVARAEESIIRHPGDHPNYSVEIEPHLDFAFWEGDAGARRDPALILRLAPTETLVGCGVIGLTGAGLAAYRAALRDGDRLADLDGACPGCSMPVRN